MRMRELGCGGLHVSTLGLGCMGISQADLREIDESASRIQPEGDRYAPAQMAMVGREAPPVGADA